MFLSLYYFVAFILVLTVHEFSHAWTAYRLGDPTAQREGRMSLNPYVHVDILGLIMLFFVGIGWGKPVPVNPNNFRHPHRDEAATAFAGPLANLILAFLGAIPYSYLDSNNPLHLFGEAVMDISIVLFLFNMLPIPPLDGSTFIKIFLPKRLATRYDAFIRKTLPYFIVVMAVDLYLGNRIFGFSLIWTAVSTATFWLKAAILLIV